MQASSERPGQMPGTSDTRRASEAAESIPSPHYGDKYGEMDLNQRGFGTNAQVADDGRVNINIKERGRRLSNILGPMIYPSEKKPEPKHVIPPSIVDKEILGPIPRLNIVIHIVGSRGDVQPFVVLGAALKERFGHRVRLATHPKFRQFVENNGLEFFNIGIDPAELMAFMVRNPGLMPGFDALRNGDVAKRRKEIAEIISGCWRSCFEAGDGMGPAVSDADLPSRCPYNSQPFIADVIIANPPSFAHVHCAEKLGIPLHMMFTMPWSPTQAFPHPLANIEFSNTDVAVANFVSYALVEMLTWQGLGDIINKFRERSLGLEPVSVMWAPGIVPRLRIPFTYCWSPTLLPKPKDWDSHIDISGFFFLSSGSDYAPPDYLANFLASGPPPVYIGFGSIVVDNPDAMTKLILEAVKKTGQRAIISQGWGGLNAEEFGIPDGVLMLGDCPHDWLFQRVSCVIHHGGAGTTAAGISCGRPTVIVPFFGDQPFWGTVVQKSQSGPAPIPHKHLTAKKLAAAIKFALDPNTQERAKEMAAKMNQENGIEAGVNSFHRLLRVDTVRCMLAPSRGAVWRVKRTKIRLSTFAAMTLSNEGILDLGDLKLYRAREYDLEPGPRDPVTGGAAALLGSLADFAMGFADIPAEMLRSLPFPPFSTPDSPKQQSKSEEELRRGSTTRLQSGSPSDESVASSESLVSSDIEESATTRERDERSIVPDSSAKSSRHKSSARREKAKNVSKITSKEILAAGEATSRLAIVGLKSPMNFALSIAKGFHNAPKLYGDRTVRDTEKITGVPSGIRAAGKELGYGFYDGISGLVTQPLRGRDEGAAGFVKGIGRGLGGLILKPGAGIFAVAGYTLSGVYKEVQKLFGTSVECYIVACRSKQGYDEWNQSTKEERDEVLARWYSLGAELESKAVRTPIAKEWDEATRVLLNSRHHAKHKGHRHKQPETDASGVEKISHGSMHEAVHRATHLLSDLVHLYKAPGGHSPAHNDEPTMEGIAGVASSENSSDDAMYERALRGSINELRNAEASGDSENAYDRAIKAGMKAATQMPDESTQQRVSPPSPSGQKEPPSAELGQLNLKDSDKAKKGKSDEQSEAGRLESEGIEDVTEYAMWRTLTDQRHAQDEKS